MSIQSNFPAIKPTLLLDFANVKQLDPRITFTRASTATYYGTQTAKAEENLLLQSQDLTNSWTNTSSSEASNTSVAPDGTTTADTLTAIAATSAHYVFQNQSASANTSYTFSCFLKAGTSNYGALTITDRIASQRFFVADFDLLTGTVRTSGAGTSGTLTSATITSAGNGWYRCVLIGQVSVATTLSSVIGVSDGTAGLGTFGLLSFTAVGTETIEVWGAQLEQRSAATAYTPTTTQTITNYIPQLLTAASNVARFDHNPTTDESLGLLIEEQRTNLLTYSEQFSDAAWTKTRSSIIANTIVAPNGTLTGDKLVEDTTASNTHQVIQSVSFTSGTAYTFTGYIKAAERTWVLFRLPSAAFTSTLQAYFNLSAGVVGAITANTTASITPVGNGWYRCSMTATATITASGSPGIFVATADNSASYTGDGYSGIYIWGAQLEAGAFATSYIPTVASQVTRSADVASMTGINFSSWYSPDQGTIYAEGFLNNPATTGAQTRRFVEMSDGTNNNKITFGRAADVNSAVRVLYTVSGTNVNGTNGQPVTGVFPSAKVAAAYQASNYAFSPNGAAVTTSTAAVVPVMNTLYIGNDSTISATGSANGTIRKIAYYPMRLINAQLQALTN
jgi:hypothetical protein